MSAKCPQNVRFRSGQKADKKRTREEKIREEKSGEENTKESVVSPESFADASRPPGDVFLLSTPYKKAQTSYTSYTSYGVPNSKN